MADFETLTKQETDRAEKVYKLSAKIIDILNEQNEQTAFVLTVLADVTANILVQAGDNRNHALEGAKIGYENIVAMTNCLWDEYREKADASIN